MPHRKREKPVERLRSALTSVADLEEALAGMFAHPQEQESAPASAQEPGTPSAPQEVCAPSSGAPNLGAAELLEPPPSDTCEVSIALDPGIPSSNTGAPSSGAPELIEEAFAFRRPRQALHEATTAQDGHTHGEQALYATLWRLAKPAGKGTFRALNIGERTLAAEVPMAYSTAQENTRSLVRKLAIEVRSSGTNKPKTYVVYGYEEILKRRREAGLTHVLRRTSGVSLVSPGAPTSSAPNFGAPIFTSGAPSFSNSGAPNLGADIRNRKELPGTTSTTVSPLIANAIISVFGFVDEQAMLTIIRESRKRAPDATDEEIAEIASWQCRRISKLRNVDNPVGLLINQVPRCFEGEPFARYRREKAEAAKRFEQQIDDHP